jgi:LPS-assembly lipoprotein
MSLARTRIAARLLAVAALAALTAGCFQPMYAEHADGTPGLREKLMGVEIPPVDKANASREARIGVEIRNALAFKLYGNATGMPPTHRLVLRFSSSRSTLIVDPTTALPTSENYGLDAQYNLIEIATNKSVMTGSTFSRVSYDIPGSIQRFARARAFRDAEDRAAQEIAENIQTRLASFFDGSRRDGRASRKRNRRLSRPARFRPSHHPALRSRRRPRSRARRRVAGVGGG